MIFRDLLKRDNILELLIHGTRLHMNSVQFIYYLGHHNFLKKESILKGRLQVVYIIIYFAQLGGLSIFDMQMYRY